MTVSRKITETLSEKTWVPLGMLCVVVCAAVGGTATLVSAAESIKAGQVIERVEREKLATEVRFLLEKVQIDLEIRTKARWSYDMMLDYSQQLDKLNRDKNIQIPDVREIKTSRD